MDFLKMVWGVVMFVQFCILCSGVDFGSKAQEVVFTFAHLATWLFGAILIAQV